MNHDPLLTPAIESQYHHYQTIVLGRSLLTAKAYWRSAQMYFDFVAEKKHTLTEESTKAWLVHLCLQCNHRANSSRASRLAGVRSVCRFLLAQSLIPSDPTKGVPSPKFSPKSMKKFSSNDLRKLFAAHDLTTHKGIRDRAILLLFYVTGLRRAEMCRLTLEQLQLGSQTGRVRVTGGKGGKSRTVSFEGTNVVQTTMAWLAARASLVGRDCETVFCNMRGESIGFAGMRMVLKQAADTAGIDNDSAFLHKLRSTYATDLYDAGIDIKTIQILMGHARVDTTMGYVVISERHLRTARLPQQQTNDLLTGL